MSIKTHRKRGHPLSGDNLYTSPQGIRHCRECKRKHLSDFKTRNPERNKEYSREWMRKQRKENPKRLQNYHFVKDYGITVEERDEKLAKQENLCAVCKRLMDKPCVDHDHDTEQVRDLLCRNCNCALGLLQDDLLILESAVAYLKKWKS